VKSDDYLERKAVLKMSYLAISVPFNTPFVDQTSRVCMYALINPKYT